MVAGAKRELAMVADREQSSVEESA